MLQRIMCNKFKQNQKRSILFELFMEFQIF
jgi:hypothetical protein